MKLSAATIQKRLGHFKDRCRQEGLSLTHQRTAVYQRLASTLEHPTAEELYDGLKAELPSLSLGTVYKTLETFEQCGVITKSRSTGEKARYDANTEPHHHLVCKVCGRMRDVETAAMGTFNFTQKEDPNFEIEEVRVDFRGICGPCRAKKKQKHRV